MNSNKLYKLSYPTFKHSDLKNISSKILIQKNNLYYKNMSKKMKILQKEFISKNYSIIDHNPTTFLDVKKQKFLSRAEILFSIIDKFKFKKDIKILDFGCNKGELLRIFKKNKYKNLYGYDLGSHYKRYYKNSKINFISNLNDKKNFFDLIIFSHSISFVNNINSTLKNILKITNLKSTLFFNTQDINSCPLNLLYEDQRYHFNKHMICNLFNKYGVIKFHTNHSLKHELIFNIRFNKRNKTFNFNSQKSNEIIKLNKIIKKIKNINTNCNILGANLNSAIAINLLKNKIKFIVDENISIKKFHKKKIINIKKHKALNIPLIIFFGKRNKEIVNRMKKKHKLNNIITI